MSARMLEAALLGRVGAVTKGGDGAQDQREANVFRVAALLGVVAGP